MVFSPYLIFFNYFQNAFFKKNFLIQDLFKFIYSTILFENSWKKYWLSQSLWLCSSQQTVEILKEMGISDHLICLLRTLYAGQEAKVRIRHEQQTYSKLGKEYVKAVYCHAAYLTYVQSTSCEMQGWMKHKLKSRFPGEISITLDMQMTPSL